MALPTLGVLDKDSAPQTISTLRSGSAVRADSAGVALSTEDIALIDGLETAIASTNTKLDTVITHVDTLETLIASTNTKLDTAITALQIVDNQQVTLLAGAANIGDVDVLTLPALVAGTANIGDVDVLSIIPGTAATNQGKAVDAVAGATDTGVAILAIRDDALTSLTPVDGDYANLRVNATGALHVTGGGGGTEYTEDAAAAADPTGQVLLAVRRDTLSASEVSADGDNIALKATNKGELRTSDADVLAAINAGVAAALPAGTNNIGDVDVLSLVPGTGATALGKAADAAAGATDTGVAILAIRDDALSALTPVEGDYAPLRVNSTGALYITGAAAGTEYTEDVAATADPLGGMMMGVRRDTLTVSEVSADGDNIAIKASNKGQMHVALADGTAVTAIVPGTGATNQGKAIDSVAGATDTGVAILAIRDDVLTTLTPADGDYAPIRVNSTGAVHVVNPTRGYSAKVSVTRPSDTTAYGAGDVVGVTGGGTATITFPNMGPGAGEIMITSAIFERDATAIISGETSYVLHLFNVTQPGAQIDNAVFDVAAGDRTAYLGPLPLGTPVDIGSTLFVASDGINKQITLAGTSLFGVLQTVGAYTPASAAVHIVTLHSVAV